MDECFSALSGVRVFIAEDEFHVMQLIESMLLDLGCSIVDCASSVGAALQRAATTDAQLAVLDVNLQGLPVYPVARLLKQREVPIVFSTGYGLAGIDTEWNACPVLQKPFESRQLASAMVSVLAQAG